MEFMEKRITGGCAVALFGVVCCCHYMLSTAWGDPAHGVPVRFVARYVYESCNNMHRQECLPSEFN
jgi:hypothetical protein